VYAGSRLSAGLALPVTLPTGDSGAFLGHGSVTVSPRLILGGPALLRVAGNASVALRRASKQNNLEICNAFTYALGAEAPFRLAGQCLAAVASLGGEAS